MPGLDAFEEVGRVELKEVRYPSESNQGDVLPGFDLLKVLPVAPSVFFDLLKSPPAFKPKRPNLSSNFH